MDWSLEHSVFCVSNVTKLCGIGLVCIVTGEIRVAAPAALNLHLIVKLGILVRSVGWLALRRSTLPFTVAASQNSF